MLCRDVIGNSLVGGNSVATHGRTFGHADGNCIIYISCPMSASVFTMCYSVYCITNSTLRQCECITAWTMFLQCRLAPVSLDIPFCVAFSLYISFSSADAGIRGTQMSDNDHSLVRCRFGGVIVKSKIPTAVAVCCSVVFRGKLRVGNAAYGNKQRCDGELLFHNGLFC